MKSRISSKWISALLILCLLITMFPISPANADSTFRDVKETDWFYKEVEFAHQNGWMKGIGNNQFDPHGTATRGMIVTVLWNAEKSPSMTGSTFQDVVSGAYYEQPVLWAVKNEIVTGYDSQTFGPNDIITREQMATILYRYAKFKGYDTTARADLAKYSDHAQIGQYAEEAMSWANAKDLIKGTDSGTVSPKGNAERAQIAAVFSRFHHAFAGNKKVVYKVIFDLNYTGGGVYKTVEVPAESQVEKPADPKRNGYSFDGWYDKANGGKVFDFKTKITADTTLYAKWKSNAPIVGSPSTSSGPSTGTPSGPAVTPTGPAVKYTVKFDTKGGDGVIPDQIVEAGKMAQVPTPPTRQNYVFRGWCSDEATTRIFDILSTPIHADMTLYAKWIAANDNLNDGVIDLGDIETLKNMGVIRVTYGENRNIRSIDGPITDKKITNEQEAKDLLNAASTLFSPHFRADDAKVTTQVLDDGRGNVEQFYRFSPVVRGVPVLGSQIILITNQDGSVKGLTSTYKKELDDVNTVADIQAPQAKDIVIAKVMGSDEVTAFLDQLEAAGKDRLAEETKLRDSLQSEEKLLIYAADVTQPVLTYEVQIRNYKVDKGNEEEEDPGDPEEIIDVGTGDDTPGQPDTGDKVLVIDKLYYIYANGTNVGEVYKEVEPSHDLIWKNVRFRAKDAQDVLRTVNGQKRIIPLFTSYRLRDTKRNIETYKIKYDSGFPVFPGEMVQINSTSGFPRTAVSLHANMEQVYDYYYNVLGRKSFDASGAKIVSTYDYDDNLTDNRPYSNAYWSPRNQQFVFGNGRNYAMALDVVGHEFTHAVVGYVVGDGVNTTLTYSGESGALNESYADIMGNLIEGKTSDWRIAEDTGTAIRDMSNPSAFGHPDHYDNRYQGTDDHGGVHINSLIYSHAFYKMVTDPRNASISRDTWARVFYHSLFRLASDAQFLDGRLAVVSAAKGLGFTSDQQKAIKEAFDKVGIVEPKTIRIVLTWGETPADLDSHLVGPGVSGGRFHIYYRQRTYYKNGSYYAQKDPYAADLDYDDTTSYGPEITTIREFTPGKYYFYVHDYTNLDKTSGSTEMARSGAMVKVYTESEEESAQEFRINPGKEGIYWSVFEITINEEKEVTIRPMDQYGYTPIGVQGMPALPTEPMNDKAPLLKDKAA